jgi:hypothetical protein
MILCWWFVIGPKLGMHDVKEIVVGDDWSNSIQIKANVLIKIAA